MEPIGEWRRLSMIDDTAGFLIRYNRLSRDEAWAAAERLVDEAIVKRELTGGDVCISVSTDMFGPGKRSVIGRRDMLTVTVEPRPKTSPRRPQPVRFQNLDFETGGNM